MRLTLFITNFLNNLREELSKFDDDMEDLEDVQHALGLSYTLWLLSKSDFDERTFGCYSLNLIAFEAIINNIERLEELIELSCPTEPALLPHQIAQRNAAQVPEEQEKTAVETEVDDDDVEYVSAEDEPAEEFE